MSGAEERNIVEDLHEGLDAYRERPESLRQRELAAAPDVQEDAFDIAMRDVRSDSASLMQPRNIELMD